MSQETFCLKFRVKGDHKIHALDWNNLCKRVWSISRDAGCGGWETLRLIREEERLILVARFGLESIEDKLPLEVIARLGPLALISKRRELEMKHGLERLEVRSETLGYNVQADDHVD